MDVLIVGAGGHGKVVLDILRAAGEHTPVGFIDADAALAGTTVGSLPVLGHLNVLPKLVRQHKITGAIIAIGDNRARLSYARILRDQGMELINAIHPMASISPTASLGVNVIVAAGAIICTDTRIGDSVILNTGAIVDHECDIGPGAHICPGALLAGRVRIGEGGDDRPGGQHHPMPEYRPVRHHWRGGRGDPRCSGARDSRGCSRAGDPHRR